MVKQGDYNKKNFRLAGSKLVWGLISPVKMTENSYGFFTNTQNWQFWHQRLSCTKRKFSNKVSED